MIYVPRIMILINSRPFLPPPTRNGFLYFISFFIIFKLLRRSSTLHSLPLIHSDVWQLIVVYIFYDSIHKSSSWPVSSGSSFCFSFEINNEQWEFISTSTLRVVYEIYETICCRGYTPINFWHFRRRWIDFIQICSETYELVTTKVVQVIF